MFWHVAVGLFIVFINVASSRKLPLQSFIESLYISLREIAVSFNIVILRARAAFPNPCNLALRTCRLLDSSLLLN
jgi:hypothetical protein